jgi:hypothetical protein
MWSRYLVMGLTALFLFAVCLPVTANDGEVRNRIDIGGDEHPWGGETRGQDEDVIGMHGISSGGDTSKDVNLVEILWDSFWESIQRQFFFTIAVSQEKSTGKEQATPVQIDQPESPSATDNGSRVQ